MRVCLVPLGRGRFALYAEPPDSAEASPAPDAGRLQHALHAAGLRWRRLVDDARARLSAAQHAALEPGANVRFRPDAGFAGRLRRWRDRVVAQLADTVDDQRALWSVRGGGDVTLLHASNLSSTDASAKLDTMLGAMRRHHGWWMIVDLLLFVLTGALFLLPGPNVIAYYFGIRAFGHLQSWRGARQARTQVRWTLEPSDAIAELAPLAELSNAARAIRVESVAARLDLPGLASFFARHAA